MPPLPPDCWASCQAWHACRLCSVIFLAGLSLTLPGAPAIGFTPTFSTPQNTMDPVALAMSQAGLPISSQMVLPPGLSSVDPPGNVQPGIVSIPGWSSVPPRLVRKILSLEFVDMWELLPESWRLDQSEGSCCHARRPRRGLVTNFLLWTECFATLVAVLATRYPEKTPHFMAYLRTITRASSLPYSPPSNCHYHLTVVLPPLFLP